MCIKIDSTIFFIFILHALSIKQVSLQQKQSVLLWLNSVFCMCVCICVFENKRQKEITRKLSHNLARGTHCFYCNLPTVFSRCISCSFIDFEEFKFNSNYQSKCYWFWDELFIVKDTNQQSLFSCEILSQFPSPIHS